MDILCQDVCSLGEVVTARKKALFLIKEWKGASLCSRMQALWKASLHGWGGWGCFIGFLSVGKGLTSHGSGAAGLLPTPDLSARCSMSTPCPAPPAKSQCLAQRLRSARAHAHSPQS